MSGIALVLGATADGPLRSATAVASAMKDRGTNVGVALDGDGVSLTAITSDWQEALSGGSLGQHGDVSVVADASLYYRDALVRSLVSAGIQPRTQGAGDLIAAAVAAWDDDAPNRLEGDFAYVAWRASTQRGHAARDPVGSRPLFFCLTSTGLAIGSSPAALVAGGVASSALNLDWLRELSAGTVNVGSETAYRDINALRQGERVRFAAGARTQTDAWYSAPEFTESGTTHVSFDDAALELRELILEAVRERLDPLRPTFVSLSGGRDSSAVYAAGRRLVADNVRSISLSYPAGDIGREDETIQGVVARCGGEPTWIDTEQVSLLSHARSLGSRPDAFVHPYEPTVSAISKRVTDSGSRVILNGLGGDTLFHAELSYLSDLALGGRFGEFRKEWKAAGGRADPRSLFRWVLLPRLGPTARGVMAGLRGGRRVHDVWDRAVPPWIVGGSNMTERSWREPTSEMGKSAADRERQMLLRGPFAGRIVPEYSRISLARGLEQRSPLYDSRIIRFAATRPRAERRTGGDYKRLLRAAMVDWLPVSVTGPRNSPTGFAGSYFSRHARTELPQLIAAFGNTMRLDDLGLVLAKPFRDEIDRFARTGNRQHVAALVFTALTESWLRELS